MRSSGPKAAKTSWRSSSVSLSRVSSSWLRTKVAHWLSGALVPVAAVSLGGRPAHMLAYNGTVPGPTLRLHPGDRLQVELVNRLSDPTNLHTHGLHVSPKGNADNTLTVHDRPGESFDYDIQLPDDHPPGPFWYHPHEHHMVADQIWHGLYGGIVVEDAGPEGPVTRG